jgi:cell growth-regulating nucleolar protein
MVRVNALDFQMNDEDQVYHYVDNGFAYDTEPVHPTFEHYESYANTRQHEPEFHDSAYFTPAPKPERERKQAREGDTTVSKQFDKKRKRSQVEVLDMSLVRAQTERDVTMAGTPPILHSGLTGGLNRLLARAEFPPSPDYSGGDYVEASPLSPMKRAKQSTSKALARVKHQYEEEEKRELEARLERQKERGRDREPKPRKLANGTVKEINGTKALVRSKREKSGREERRRRRRSSSSPPPERKSKPMKAIEYHREDSASPAPGINGNGAVVLHSNGNTFPKDSGARAELFMSFINKGPESERGCSVNKVLKRYHRERYDRWDRELSKPDEEKELWKSIRLKRNDRGEIVLFV